MNSVSEESEEDREERDQGQQNVAKIVTGMYCWSWAHKALIK